MVNPDRSGAIVVNTDPEHIKSFKQENSKIIKNKRPKKNKIDKTLYTVFWRNKKLLWEIITNVDAPNKRPISVLYRSTLPEKTKGMAIINE